MYQYQCLNNCFLNFMHKEGQYYTEGEVYEFGPDVRVPELHFESLNGGKTATPDAPKDMEVDIPTGTDFDRLNAPEPEVEMESYSLENHSLEELKDMAKAANIKGWALMKKPTLVRKLDEMKG